MTLKKTITNFATAEHPIRASSLPMLLSCGFRQVILHLDLYTDEAGEKADTGSAIHKAVAVWHTNNHNEQESIDAMKISVNDFPKADIDAATKIAKCYFKDPTNQKAELLCVEKQITFELDPHETDKTQQKIVITGTLDQIRIVNGELKLFDLKNSGYPGYQVMCSYWPQIAAYCIGATELYSRPVQPGGIIMTKNYLKKGVQPELAPQGIFFNYVNTLEHARIVMDQVRMRIALIRNGDIHATSGAHCTYCFTGGIEVCYPLHERILSNG